MDLLDIPLSLQDMCMLCIVFKVEEFPVQSLALLPREIRRKLLFGLSQADVLHLAGTKLFDDVDWNQGHSKRDYSYISNSRQRLLDVILSGGQNLSLHLKDVLRWFSSREEYQYDSRAEGNLIDHICKCYPSLEPTKIKTSYNSYCVLPKRSLPFVKLISEESVNIYDGNVQKKVVPMVLPSPLFAYCNVQLSAPTVLKIDCHDFTSSTIWREFDKVVVTTINAAREEYRNTTKRAKFTVDLVIPVLQEFLSSVEVLELGTDSTPRDVDGLEDDMHTVPYVILYNILSSHEPRLKHLKIYSIPMFIDWILDTVMQLLHPNSAPAKSMFAVYRSVEVLSPLTTLYMLEGISVLPDSRGYGYGFEYMLTSHALSISCDVMTIVKNHKEKLRSVAVNDLGYCYDYDNLNVRDLDDRVQHIRGNRNINVPSYTSLLSSFVQFVKQPSFTDLSVGKSPLPEAYKLIKAFLFTPAAHKQSLRIEASSERSVPEMEELEDEKEEDDERQVDEDKNREAMEIDSTLKEESRKREPVTNPSEAPSQKIMKPNSPVVPPSFSDQPLPDSNAQYKCLDLGFSSSCVYSWLFTLPELKLKELRMRTQDMTIVPPDLAIQVEHVAFTTETHYCTSYKPTITPAHLEKFVILNTALKRLEFTDPTDECAPGLIPALNHCLSTLYQQGRGLDELIMNRVQFQNIEHMKEFFIRVRDLSHCHGTTLVLSGKYYRIFNSYQDESTIFEKLSKEFQEKKIKKINYTIRDDHDPSPYFSVLAETMEVQYRP